MSIKVSLIIPVYNVESYLRNCLDSACTQTLQEIEIVVVNDGSTDQSLSILTEYQAKDPRVKLFSQSNQGQGYARNLAIREAVGEFIFCLDGDDIIAPHTLAQLYQKSQDEASDVVICGWQRIDEMSGDILATREDIHALKSYDKETINRTIFSGRMNLMACASLIKRSIITDNYILYPNLLHEDLYVMPKVYFFAKKITIDTENLYSWLVRSTSTTNTFTMQHAIGIAGIANEWRMFLLKEGVYESYKDAYVQGVIAYLDSYLRKVYAFATPQEKDQLLEFLTDTLRGIHELADYSIILSDKELEARKSLLHFYQNVTSHKQTNCKKLVVQNSLLKSQLNEIKSSRGYKLLLKYYRTRERHLPIGSRRREVVKHLANFIAKRELSVLKPNKNPKRPTPQMHYDIIFLPHKDYQVWTMGLITRALKAEGITACMMDLTDYYKDEGAREAIKQFEDIDFKDLSVLLEHQVSYDALICMNDWDQKVTRPLILEAQKDGKKTIGIIEGINDFHDSDIPWQRHAYQTVEYLLMTGEHDRAFFPSKTDKSYVIGVPRLQELMQETPHFPKKPLAVINLNFSYGILEDQRDAWLTSVLEGCSIANIDYVITQHPADHADLSDYHVSTKNMYDTIREGTIIISRFGSIILEALAMGKPAIYHNPHQEKVVKFQDPMGAYSTSQTVQELAEAIRFELGLSVDYRERANTFLNHHCNINQTQSSATLAAKVITTILKEHS